MKSRRVIVLLSMIFLLVLAACGGGNNDNGVKKKENKSNDSNDSASGEEVDITWWAFPNFQEVDGKIGKYEQDIIDAFKEKNPDVNVKLEMVSFEGGTEKLNMAISTNTAPDVIYDAPGRIIDWGKKDLLAPLNDMFPTEVTEDISEAIMKQSKVDEDVFMYPFNTGPFMMAVNKTIFEEIDALDLLPLDREDRTWTVAEYEKALQAVKENAPDVIPSGFYAKSVAGDQGTRAYIANLGGATFVSDDLDEITINQGDGAAGLEWLVKADEEGWVAPGAASMDAGDHNDLFLQGKMAFAVNYSAVLKTLFAPDKTGDFEEVLLPYPTPNGEEPQLEPFLGGLAVFDNDDDAKIEASKKLIDFIVNDEEWGEKNLIQTGGLSARNSITGLYDDSEYEYSELARKFIADPPTLVDGYAEIRTFWFPALQEALLGAKSPQEALDDFTDKANETIKKEQK